MTRLPACPRCRYDQSGSIATWQDSCPVAGQCSECGLTFLWRDVLNEKFRALDGYFEHAPRFSPIKLINTILAVHRPWQFWSKLQMHHRIEWARLISLFLIATLFVLPICIAAWLLAAVVVTQAVSAYTSGGVYAGPVIENTVWQALRMTRDSSLNDMFTAAGWAGLWAAAWCLIPFTLALLPQTRRRCRFHASHVARVAVYSFALVPVLLMIRGTALLALHLWTYVTWTTTFAASPGVTTWIMWLDRWWYEVVFGVQVAIVWWFWSCALRRYGRVPHAEGVALAAVTIATAVVTWAAFITGLYAPV